jgi:hypothetical protein
VDVDDGDVAEVFLAEADAVGEDELDRVLRPGFAGSGPEPAVVEQGCDRVGAEPIP